MASIADMFIEEEIIIETPRQGCHNRPRYLKHEFSRYAKHQKKMARRKRQRDLEYKKARRGKCVQ